MGLLELIFGRKAPVQVDTCKTCGQPFDDRANKMMAGWERDGYYHQECFPAYPGRQRANDDGFMTLAEFQDRLEDSW